MLVKTTVLFLSVVRSRWLPLLQASETIRPVPLRFYCTSYRLRHRRVGRPHPNRRGRYKTFLPTRHRLYRGRPRKGYLRYIYLQQAQFCSLRYGNSITVFILYNDSGVLDKQSICVERFLPYNLAVLCSPGVRNCIQMYPGPCDSVFPQVHALPHCSVSR